MVKENKKALINKNNRNTKTKTTVKKLTSNIKKTEAAKANIQIAAPLDSPKTYYFLIIIIF
jgi:hypothetical protein